MSRQIMPSQEVWHVQVVRNSGGWGSGGKVVWVPRSSSNSANASGCQDKLTNMSFDNHNVIQNCWTVFTGPLSSRGRCQLIFSGGRSCGSSVRPRPAKWPPNFLSTNMPHHRPKNSHCAHYPPLRRFPSNDLGLHCAADFATHRMTPFSQPMPSHFDPEKRTMRAQSWKTENYFPHILGVAFSSGLRVVQSCWKLHGDNVHNLVCRRHVPNDTSNLRLCKLRKWQIIIPGTLLHVRGYRIFNAVVW
ncbi:hypothetical protein EDC04DRAFT_684139 [Pisolithus marmoratus]|nr:hypothetical protein EDC04DRAFT_684139 [Pisolithus marmoratus]